MLVLEWWPIVYYIAAFLLQIKTSTKKSRKNSITSTILFLLQWQDHESQSLLSYIIFLERDVKHHQVNQETKEWILCIMFIIYGLVRPRSTRLYDNIIFHVVQATDMIADFHSFIDVAENGGHLIVIGMVVTDDGELRWNKDATLAPAAMTHTDGASLLIQSGMISQVTLGPFRWEKVGRVRACFLLSFNQLHLFVIPSSYVFSAFSLR